MVTYTPIMRKVYIGGPMTGLPDRNAVQFQEAVACLIKAGYKPVNPHELNQDKPASTTRADFMRTDLKALMDCDGIMLLTGWEKSLGARCEYLVANQLGLMIFYEKGAVQFLENDLPSAKALSRTID